MAVRFDASTDYLSRTASAPAQYPLTVTFWLYITTDRNAYGALFLLANSGGTSFISFNLSSSGTNLQINVNGNTTNGSSLNVGQWYHIACVIASATSQKMYLDGVLDINKTSVSTTFTPAQFFIGSDSVGWLNGREGDMKIFERELTAEEIKHEMSDIEPQLYPAWAFYPMDAGASERVLDYSGNGRNLTANGSLTDEAGPPVWFGNDTQWQLPGVVTGAQTITDALYADADSFGADTLKQTIVDAKLTDGDTFGADAVKLSITDARLVDGDTFGADGLRLSIADAKLTDADAFGADQIGLSIVDTLYADADSFGADALRLSIADARLADGDTFGADALTLSISDAAYSDPDTFGADTLTQGGGAQTITDALYSDPDVFGSDTLTLSLTDARLIDGDAFGVDTLGLSITDAQFVDADSFGADRVWTMLPTPAERVWPVEYEARVLAVVVGNRTWAIAGESRMVAVAHENRALPIARENRVVVVSD